jgi:hypothetical protein
VKNAINIIFGVLLCITCSRDIEAANPRAISDRLRCAVVFFEAHFQLPKGYDRSKDPWLMTEKMHAIFKKPPLASYAYFRKVESAIWPLEILKPMRHEFVFLRRFELTYLEGRLTSLGQTVYRFEHKVNHLRSVETTLDALEPAVIFIQHHTTYDHFLHLTCVAD